MLLCDKAKKLAGEARVWAEKIREENPYDYSPQLQGLCARASGYLHTLLTAENIPAMIAYNDKHCYVLVGKKAGVDITATQFGFQEKVLVFDSKKSQGYFWEHTRLFGSAAELTEYQKIAGWPKYQLAIVEDLV